MNNRNTFSRLSAILLFAGISFSLPADEIAHGRDNDIPDSQPPAETETTTSENLLQQLFDLVGIDIE